ncbi:MAG: hypothetical protein KF729_30230 [Sandaracinaceae bacterium]|nr:hypothetical protein [Sandaracinaceae bacterium]
MADGRVLVERPGLRVLAGPPTRVEGRAEVLDALAAAHAAIDAPQVPRLERAGDALALEVPMVAALPEILAQLGREGARLDYGVAVAFNERLMDATEAGHAAGHFLGALAWTSLLASADGRLWLFGFGLDRARPAPTEPGACLAPELALGLEASAAADVFVLHAMLRTLLPFCRLPESYAAALTSGGRAGALYGALMALSEDALAPDPLRRPPTVAALRARYRAIRPLAPDMPEADPAGLARVVREAVRAPDAPTPTLRVDAHARTLTLAAAAPIALARRALLWRLVERLLDAHARAPGTPLSADALVEAGWPGERILPDAARTRLYTAIRALRRGGLEPILWSRDGGYLLDPSLRVERTG